MNKIQWGENLQISICTVALQIVLYWGLTGVNPGPWAMTVWLVLNMAIATVIDYATNR